MENPETNDLPFQDMHFHDQSLHTEGRSRLINMVKRDMLHGVIFDLDGTLVKSNISFGPYRERLGIQGDVIAGISALPEKEQQEKWAIIDEYEKELEKFSKPAPGVKKLLAHLQQKGIRSGVITRSTGIHAQKLVHQHDLAVDITIGREDTRPKPHPDGINYLLERLHVKPENAIMVGDFLWDLLAGKRAGLLTVLVVQDYSRMYMDKADMVIESLHELFDLLQTDPFQDPVP